MQIRNVTVLTSILIPSEISSPAPETIVHLTVIVKHIKSFGEFLISVEATFLMGSNKFLLSTLFAKEVKEKAINANKEKIIFFIIKKFVLVLTND
jgi:hypothetical protein